MRTPSFKVLEQVVMVLWNLSINADNKVRMADKGVLPSLVSLLRSPEERIQELAVGGLADISCLLELANIRVTCL